MSIAANQLESVLDARFPGIRFGRYNCRRIAGSEQYSQHSWSNARDLYAPTDSENPDAFIDVVVDWLEANAEALSVRLILWQVPNHYSHAHVDLWPQGYAVPPCDGGGLPSWLYQDGTIYHGPDPGPQNGTYEGELEVDEDTLRRIVREEIVEALGGDTIDIPNSTRKGNQGIVNSVWWSVIGGTRAHKLLKDGGST